MLRWGLLLKSISRRSYVSVENCLPLEGYIILYQGGDLTEFKHFLVRYLEKSSWHHLYLSWVFPDSAARDQGSCVEIKAHPSVFPSYGRVWLSLGDCNSVFQLRWRTWLIANLHPTPSIHLLGVANDVSFLFLKKSHKQELCNSCLQLFGFPLWLLTLNTQRRKGDLTLILLPWISHWYRPSVRAIHTADKETGSGRTDVFMGKLF